VAIAVCDALHFPSANSIGVDVMKIRIPARETFLSFVQTVSDQLTAREYDLLFNGVTEYEGSRRFFWMWTMKEAYTKALGIGLGFDFKRVEYIVSQEEVFVDGKILKGWIFRKFEIIDKDDLYLGVVAHNVGGEQPASIFPVQPNADWLTQIEAAGFAEEML